MQSGCFALFAALFFYCCWPYRAEPLPSWSGFIPIEIDAATGQTKLVSGGAISASLRPNQIVHISDASKIEPNPSNSGYLGAFVVAALASADSLLVRPTQSLPAERLEELSLSTGPWTLSLAPPDAWPAHFADSFALHNRLPVDLFLLIDPLVGLSTALAARTWTLALGCTAVILAVCILIPRGFCGYLCPLGTLIDLFDWAIGRRVVRFRVPDNGWWVHLKYYLLAAVLVAAVGGVLISGYLAAIPVLTRGLMFIAAPVQLGLARGWHQVPEFSWGHAVSIALFLGVLALGLLRPRFWCTYVCPSGAVFSLSNAFRAAERKVEDSCIHCGKCVEICPFDAIKPDFTTRVTDCTLCQTCGGVCPTRAIKFVERSNRHQLKLENFPPTHEGKLGRRSFFAAAAGLAAGTASGVAAALGTKALGANLDVPGAWRPVRPPGSVPEREFLQLCIRCAECFKVCPNNVLQPLGFHQGFEGLWTPHVVADWAGCEPSCNACGAACPTGAIQPLPLEKKREARMGLAVVDPLTCLPLAEKEACQLCVDECAAAGYDAIEFIRVGTAVGKDGLPIEGTGFLAPRVVEDRCVGCGLCQTRCYGINAKTRAVLRQSAIVIRVAR